MLFDSVAKLEERLELVGLPGREIASMSNPTKIYSVSINQLRAESRVKKRKTHSIVDCRVIPIIDFDYSYFVQNP